MNDNTPVWSFNFSGGKIYENLPINSLLVDLNAIDIDKGNKHDASLSFSIFNSTDNSKSMLFVVIFLNSI